MSEINKKQQLFICEYIRTFNATRAAIAAGYSEKTAYSQGARLLKNAEILKAVNAFLDENAMSAAEVVFHLTEIARGDFNEIADSAGFLDMEQARRNNKTRLIKRTKQRTTTSGDDFESHEVEVEMYDRLTALGLLAKYHNLTNTVRVEDWRTQAIQDIKDGKLSYEALAEAFDDSLAADLFRSAGISIQVSESATAE